MIFVAFVLWAGDVYADVMDKEPSLAENWIWSVVVSLIAIAAWRWKWWVGLVVTSIALIGLLVVFVELQDPLVGGAMRLESGGRYVGHFYLAVAAAVLLNATGVYVGLRRRRRGK